MLRELAIRSSEPKVQEKKQDEAEGEKDGAAAMVKRTVDDIGMPMRGRHGEHVNSESVAEDTERKNCESEHPFLPSAAEEHVASDEAGNEENETRADATTLLSDHDGEVGENKRARFA